MRDAVDAAEFASKGSWPMAGGTLDQTASFWHACRFVWDYGDAVRSEGETGLIELLLRRG